MGTNNSELIPKLITGSDGVQRTYYVKPEEHADASSVPTALSKKSFAGRTKKKASVADSMDEESINMVLDSMTDEERSSADADEYRTALSQKRLAAVGAFSTDTSSFDVVEQMSKGIKDGGATIRADGAIPMSGMCYSPYPERSFAKPVDELTPADMIRYVHQNKDLLSKEGNCIGVWHNRKEDGGDDQVYLDISCVTHSAEDARQKCVDSDQIAFFDMNRFEEVTVDRNASSGGVATS